MPGQLSFAVFVSLFAFAGCGDSAGTKPDTRSRIDAAVDTSSEDMRDETGSADVRSLDQGSPAPTYESFAKQFMQSYCSPCHWPGQGTARDLSSYATVTDPKNLPRIRCGVAPTQISGCTGSPRPAQFPVGAGPKPSLVEREQLVRWIDDGAPER